MVARRPSLAYQGLISLVSGLMVLALLQSQSGFWKMQVPVTTLAVYAVGAVLFAWLSWRVPWAAALVVLAASVANLAAASYSPAWATYLQVLLHQAQEFRAQVQQTQFDSTFGPRLGALFLLAIALVIALVTQWEALRSGRAFWSMAAGAIIFGTQWSWYYDKSNAYFVFYAIAAFALWVLAQAAQRDVRWVGSGRRVGNKSHVSTPLTLVLVAAIFASTLPTEFGTVNLGKLGDKLQEAVPILKQLRGGGPGGRFSLRATGFAPNLGLLGGPIQLDSTPALQLITPGPLDRTAYLRGTTLNTYTGQQWLPGDIPPLQIPKDGNLPTIYGPDVQRQYQTMKVRPLQNLGKTIFNVFEPLSVLLPRKGTFKADSDGNLFADKTIPKNSTYQISMRLVTYSADQIRLLSTAPPSSGYARYLQLPPTLPNRVRSMAEAVSAQAVHPYDKAVAVESYLRRQRYSLDVPATPAGRDFVDFYLFDQRLGYCVYSASAMTVMLRHLGIPSRVVEGFAVPPTAEATTNPEGERVYSVLNSQSHAWVEAYFPGYGWVTFDPTPRADLPRIDRSAPLPAASGLTPSVDDNQTPRNPAQRDPAEADRNLEDPTAAEGTGAGAATAASRRLPWAGGALVLLSGGAYLLFRRLQMQDRLVSAGARNLIQEAWDKTADLLGRFGFGRRGDQTAREYAQTLAQTLPTMSEPLARLADDYTVARYAPPDRPVDPAAPSRARELWADVHGALMTRFGWRRYLWRRLRFNRVRARPRE